MKSNMLPILCAIGGLTSTASVALAADKDAAVGNKTEIHLNQQAERIMARDRIRAILRVETKGDNARQIQAAVNRLMAASLDKVKANPAIMAETGSYAVFQNYNPNRTELWQASQTLTLSSADFEAVLNLVGDLQNNGLLVSQMQFFLAPETLKAAQDDLTAEALKALQERAQGIAGDLGMSIDRVKQINIGNAMEMVGQSRSGGAGPTASAGGRTPPPVAQAGEALVALTVNADVILAPGKR